MSFSYDAGGTTPTYAGLLEFNGVRLNDGTFKSQRIPLIVDSPPVRPGMFPLGSDHGGFAGATFYGEWEFDLELWMWVPTGPDDLPAALDYLRAAFNLKAGLKNCAVKGRNWSQKRQTLARVTGQISVTEPEIEGKKVPKRVITIPMAAPDPRVFAETQQDVTISGSTSITNAGNADAPFVAKFIGPQTHPMRVTAPDGSYIEYNADVASGHYVLVNTRDATSGTTTVVDDLGASQYANLTKASASVIAPGTASWTKSNGGGAGATHVLFYDAWS